VNVAIEALRNFNAIQSPEKTKEYLISPLPNYRDFHCSLIKCFAYRCLRTKEIELRKEKFDLYQLAEEIIATMRLQFDKVHATVTLAKEG
jgi:hypothetical protein